MSRGFTIELDGLQETLTKLSKEVNDRSKKIDDELGASVELMARSAKRMAPVDTGRLRASISPSRVAFLSWEIVAQTNYAAYVEFGTGRLVDVPKGLEAYAMQFKGKGKRQVNIPARPYLYPSVMAYKVKLSQRITEIIRNEKRI